jgi:hypothetical protein
VWARGLASRAMGGARIDGADEGIAEAASSHRARHEKAPRPGGTRGNGHRELKPAYQPMV